MHNIISNFLCFALYFANILAIQELNMISMHQHLLDLKGGVEITQRGLADVVISENHV